jgi:CheY-like chemotaxis protein
LQNLLYSCRFNFKDIKILFEQRFRKEIREHEIEFVFAYSGEEAIYYLEKHLHEAVLILSDINMPGMSGLELLSYIKNKHAAPPPVVMMITAYGDDDNYKQAISLGADEFITKPLDFTLLKDKLKKQFDDKNIGS